jgi:hypothetical protein
MKSAKTIDNKDVRMELKYCERCGALGLRECGAGVVYCDHCLLEVAELPPSKKNPGRISLPVKPHTLMEEYELDDDDLTDFEAAGGAA